MSSRFRDLEEKAGIDSPPRALPVISAHDLEIQRLQQENTQLQQLLHQRAEPILTAVIDALLTTATLAANGHPGARRVLGAWHQAVDAANASRSFLIVPSDIAIKG